MNTSSLKSFAPAVRRQLMEAVGRKLDYVLTADTPDLRQAVRQVASLRKEAERNRAALVDRVAYTWFNRLAALRFLDALGWHPFKARVLTPATPQETQPELLKLLRTGSLPAELHPHTDLQRLNDLLDGRLPTAIAGADPQGEAYRGLILAACRLYHTLLPDVFDKLNDESELLLPDDLLTANSVAEGFRTEITDADGLETDASGKERANVEILGWLYQFYISERKDQVMARKSAVPTEDIPAVTQLFTPHWIVRYLVENSLGRLWLLNRPGSRLREHMPYYIEGEEVASGKGLVTSSEAPSSHQPLATSHFAAGEDTPDSVLKIERPEDIKLLDPACGSAHMLTYAFDLLTLIYEEEGYAPTEIPALILRYNLHGLEICPRAAQLAELALVFKAREKSRRFFQPEHLVRPRIIELRDVRFAENELRDYIHALGLGDLFNQPVLKLLHQFEEAKNFGSLIQPCLDERAIADVRRAIEAKDLGGQLFLRETHLKVLRVLDQAEALTQRYHVVVANPPYMGGSQMNPSLKAFVRETIPEGDANLFAAFILRNLKLALSGGRVSMIALSNWLFLSDYEDVRRLVLSTASFHSLVDNGRGVWGSDFDSCFFVLLNQDHSGEGVFRRLFKKEREVQSNEELQQNFANRGEYPEYRATSADFEAIPGSPIAFWLSAKACALFATQPPLSSYADLKVGLQTGDNGRFLRLWFEVPISHISFEGVCAKRWYPYCKGGEFRRWYGNAICVVDWSENGSVLREFRDDDGKKKAYLRNPTFYFRDGVEWSDVGQSVLGARYRPKHQIFDVVSMSLFEKRGSAVTLFESLAFLNTTIASKFLNVLAPGMHYNTGYVSKLPVKRLDNSVVATTIATQAVSLARADWDNFETSWDFRDQPLLRPGLKGATLEASWRNWEAQSTAAIRRMQELETENNRLFIAAYGLDGELQPEVPEAQITLARADARRDMAAFLSYAVGCMMGRFSLDAPGLILANAGDTLEDYVRIVAAKTVASGEGLVTSLEASSHQPLATSHPTPYESNQLQGSDRVAEGDPTGRGSLSGESQVSQGGNVRAHQSVAAGRGIDPVEHRGGTSTAGNLRVQALPVHRPGISGGGGDTTDHRDQTGLLDGGDFGPSDDTAHRNRQDAPQSDPEVNVVASSEGLVASSEIQTSHQPLTTSHSSQITSHFLPDEDGIIPVLDGEWFEDDIVARTRDFLRATFGEATLKQNLRFIEDSLGKPLDKYFLTDFYKDHLQTYKKRPIYWLFQSPKRGFSALVYLHRYTRDTVNTLLNGYLRDYLKKLESRIDHLSQVEATSTVTKEKTAARKEAEKLRKDLKDCQDWERNVILPLAQQRLEIDLDDGVKVNYLKFDGAVSPIPGLAAKED